MSFIYATKYKYSRKCAENLLPKSWLSEKSGFRMIGLIIVVAHLTILMTICPEWELSRGNPETSPECGLLIIGQKNPRSLL